MAPERCRREALTPATDIFGLGATLYEALTAMQPFSEGHDDAEELELRYPQLSEEPIPVRELRPEIPPLLGELVMSCLARQPRGRPASAIECAAALEDVLVSLGKDELLAWPRGLRARPRR